MYWKEDEWLDKGKREKVMRGLKVDGTLFFPMYQICHNFIRPHSALGVMTPLEAAWIGIVGGE